MVGLKNCLQCAFDLECDVVIDTLAEWSKAVDSSSTIFGCVGSNPTGVIFA